MGNQKITVDVDINGHIKGFEQAVSKANQALKGLRIDDKSTQHAKDMFKTLQVELGKYQQLSQDALSGKNVASALNTSKNRIISTLRTIGKEYESLGRGDIGFSEEIRKLQDELTTLKSGFSDIGSSIANQFGNNITTSVTALNGKMKAGVGYVEDFMTALKNGNPDEVADKFEKLEKYQSRFGEKSKDFTAIFQTCKTANEAFGTSIESTNIEMANLQQRIDALSDQDFAALQSIVEKLGLDFDEFSNYIREATEENTKLSASTRESQKEFSNLESRIKQFFSLTNGFILFRRAVQGAFNTIKELDAVMTETAVVTDFSVSDMWEKLPEYTKMANELGATTKGAYETATLYYQQGLKTNEVMAVSAETMKMARIAGLDYATATDYMTAALRGFNMEINTDSAQRVNDVYSRLAAITASNTQEISVAMTKVASLAHNANMEFETTAAFLAQIIETTRESAETAGTALKTVVARFTEVKKLYNEGELMGTDEEGEEIDVNKVATALRSAGIDMNRYFTGLVGLDDIFMELASKWDSLDKVQQRYIATMAAGSRQQSRFIAMMSNYQRTLELVGEAQNSAGAGQKQFDKTMESLEAKLNRLKNAWDSFLMGLANSDIIKGAVDWLTDLITKLNEFINGMSNGNGILKTFVTLMTTLAGMKLGKSLLTGTTEILSGLMGNKGANQNGKKVGWLERIGTALTKRKIGQVTSRSEFGDIWETRQATIADDVLRIFNKFKGLSFKEGFDVVVKGIGKSLEGWLTPLKAIGTYLAPAGPYIAGLLAILAVIKLIKAASEQQKHLAENLRAEAASLKEEIDNVKETISNLSSQEEVIKGMTKGTLEWRLAVQKLNEEYEKLLEKNPEYGEFILQDKYGNYYVDEEKEAAWEQKKENQATYKLNRADQVEVEQAQKAYEKALSKAQFKINLQGQASLTSEQVKDIVEALDTGQIYDEQSWQRYQEENNINTSLSFKDLNSATQSTTTALHNFMEALNIYAQKMGFGSITGDEYDSAKDATKTQIEADTANMTNKELYDYAIQQGLSSGQLGMDIEREFNGLGGELTLEDILGFSNDKALRDFIINAITEGTELDIGSGLNLSGQGAGWYLGQFNTGEYGPHSEAADTHMERQKTFEEMSKESNTLGVDISEQVAAWNSEELIDKRKAILELDQKIQKAGQNATEEDQKRLKVLEEQLAIEEKQILAEIENADNAKKAENSRKKTVETLKKSLLGVESAEDITENVAKDISKAFQLPEDAFSIDFLKENFALLQGIINGDIDALNNFIAVANNAGVEVGFTADGQQFLTTVNELDETTQALIASLIAAGAYEIREVKLDAGVAYLKPIFKTDDVTGAKILDGFESAVASGEETVQVVVPAQAPEIPGGNTTPTSPSTPSGGGGGGGGNENPDRWLNPYDKFYNLTEQINEALRQREKLERNYDRILKNRWSKQRDIQANTQARLNSLKQEIAMNKALLAGRQSQVDAVLNEKFLDDDKNIRTFREFGVGRYANYNTERGTIEIDWEGLERLSGTTDTQLGGVIEDYVSRLEELQKQFEDVDKTIEDLEDEVAEILDINKEEYLSFEQRVFDAIVDRQQKLIDSYSELSDTISNNDEEVLNALSESIDLSRQIRDNTKTEEEIAQKEARLAYLRRDTSGANDLAIKQLEKELEEARQSYGDTLVDQELDRLSQASEEAAKQRERQIEIMEKQLEWQQRIGFFWPEVIDLLQNNYGELDEGISDALMDLLKNTDAFRGMSEYQQANWAQELHEQWLQSESGLASWRLSEAKAASLGKEGNESNYSIAANQTTAGKALRYDYNRDMWMDEDEGWYTGVSYDATSNQFTYEGYSSKASRDEEEAKKTAAAQAAQAKRNVTVGSYINAGNAPIYTSAYGGSPLHQYFADDPKYLVLDDYGSSWMVRWHGLSSGITGFFRKGDVRAYKTGGLVDYTGPAWLDGTPSRPEFVLNADQTQAFMKLVDKLGSGVGAGDNYFDINIVVDELSSDYDVDQMVDRIKQKITEDAQYRNVNAINWIR